MNDRRLGRTGLKVSEINPGTMTFAGQCDEPTSILSPPGGSKGGTLCA